MQRQVLSILVENQTGVLSRISGLFSRRGYNIDSLSVGVTEDPTVSRITVVTIGDDNVLYQIRQQLGKLIDVLEVAELPPDDSVTRELVLIKVRAEGQKRGEIISITEIFRANIIDVSLTTLTIEMTGSQNKIDALIQMMQPYGVCEIVRTGLTGLQRGATTIKSTVASDL
ncbi:MAG: acetolactate synthase small subunit [Clostridiales bacterium]|jgi:acetolactate synthase-1/3 small subunit|nr:acetolactate synthase small subunit [Clostridiales bacterium]